MHIVADILLPFSIVHLCCLIAIIINVHRVRNTIYILQLIALHLNTNASRYLFVEQKRVSYGFYLTRWNL